MRTNNTGYSLMWTREQDKAFENALAIYFEDSSDRWEKIAAAVPGKTLEEIKYHYSVLVEDVDAIESGLVPLPCYASINDSTNHAGDVGVGWKGSQSQQMQSDSSHGGKSSRSDQERRRGIAWTEEEHRLFLMGLEKHGKGDWRSISRNFVLSRTPTQVASHAQKFFNRLNAENKERRRSSIHDITSVHTDTSALQGPITGQLSGTAAVGCNRSGKAPLSRGPDVGVFGRPTIDQPTHKSPTSAVGTSMNFPYPKEMVYGAMPSTPGSLVPGAPRNMARMTYFTHSSNQKW